MLSHLLDASIRSLLLAIPAGIVLCFVRKRTSAVQHAVWTVVLTGMLALVVFGPAMPRLPLRVLSAPKSAAVPGVDPAPIEVGPPAVFVAPPSAPARSVDWAAIAVALYAAIAVAFLARFTIGLLLARRLLVGARQVGGSFESARISVPVTVGLFRPRVFLPREWREWDRDKLDAVLAHECAHLRRRDGLVAALAAINRSLFWFHPLAWFLERKLALLAEQACDESCVVSLGDRRSYARLLVEMALTVDSTHGRLRSHALTMASGSHIRRRVECLLDESRAVSRGLSRGARIAIALCALPAVWGAATIDLQKQEPLLRLSLPHWRVPSAPVLRVQSQPAPQSPTPPAAAQMIPKFDVVSVKACGANNGLPPDGAGGAKGGRGTSPGNRTPGRVYLGCLPVRVMLAAAMSAYSSGNFEGEWNNGGAQLDVIGGPDWMRTDRYILEAKAEGTPSRDLMQGPMLKAVLEDRFHLRTHRETREVPTFDLTVAKGGPKLLKPGDLSCTEPDAGGPARGGRDFVPLNCGKLQVFQEGSCTPRELAPQIPPEERKALCGVPRMTFAKTALVADIVGASFDQIAHILEAGRPVMDRTGLAGKYDFHLEHLPPDAAGSDEPDALPSIFTALSKLGLKLEPSKGPRNFLVIDRIERPTEN
jgi:uncharacterized protein (TIGR03435 family)